MKANVIQGLLQQERWCFPWWIKNDGGFKFQISYEFAAHDVMLHQKKKIIEITMMITRCHPRVNDKRPPMETVFIDMLFKIIKGRGLV
jgi:hypothetical protein